MSMHAEFETDRRDRRNIFPIDILVENEHAASECHGRLLCLLGQEVQDCCIERCQGAPGLLIEALLLSLHTGQGTRVVSHHLMVRDSEDGRYCPTAGKAARALCLGFHVMPLCDDTTQRLGCNRRVV